MKEQIKSITESGAKFCEAYKAVDTEIGFAHLKELLNAEAEGRLLVLPCAPGAEVWVVDRDEDGCAVDVSGYMFLAKRETPLS